MSKLIIGFVISSLLVYIILYITIGCTDKGTSRVECPCIVNKVEKTTINEKYYIHAGSTKYNTEFIRFYTNIHHQLGDTIQ